MSRVVDIVVVLNAMAALAGWMWRRHRKNRRSANLEHMQRLELENREMDEILSKLNDERR